MGESGLARTIRALLGHGFTGFIVVVVAVAAESWWRGVDIVIFVRWRVCGLSVADWSSGYCCRICRWRRGRRYVQLCQG
jgi:hypothetical protein